MASDDRGWPPSSQVERVLDLMDINYLRDVSKGIDCAYKTQIWNLSQNVDRETGSGKPGVCGAAPLLSGSRSFCDLLEDRGALRWVTRQFRCP